MTFLPTFLLVFFALVGAASAQPASPDEQAAVGSSGLPIPRFASLHADEANMRTGPGTRYPIEWVYVREGLPVEITAEFEIWRRVRDWEGSEGWVHKSVLTGKRTLIVTGQTRQVYEEMDDKSAVKAHVEQGVIGALLGCGPEWCKVKFDDINGYMPKSAFWGVYANETFN